LITQTLLTTEDNIVIVWRCDANEQDRFRRFKGRSVERIFERIFEPSQ